MVAPMAHPRRSGSICTQTTLGPRHRAYVGGPEPSPTAPYVPWPCIWQDAGPTIPPDRHGATADRDARWGAGVSQPRLIGLADRSAMNERGRDPIPTVSRRKWGRTTFIHEQVIDERDRRGRWPILTSLRRSCRTGALGLVPPATPERRKRPRDRVGPRRERGRRSRPRIRDRARPAGRRARRCLPTR